MSGTAQIARDMLLWLDEKNAVPSNQVITATFLGKEFDQSSEQLDDQQRLLLGKVCGRLLSAGLIEGFDADQEENYPVLAWLTPDGHRCIEEFDGDVRRWEERNVSRVDRSINVDTGGGASQFAAYVSGDVTQNQVISGIDVEKLKQAAELMRDSLPALRLPAEEAQQAEQAVEEILTEAELEQPNQGLLARAGTVLQGVLSVAQSGATLVPIISDVLSKALGG